MAIGVKFEQFSKTNKETQMAFYLLEALPDEDHPAVVECLENGNRRTISQDSLTVQPVPERDKFGFQDYRSMVLPDIQISQVDERAAS